ncbi:hypothetical protein M378DRAFT_166153 [Amanita muscaria Koide BX008]|uniref:CoA-transferase family III n=1 Tax=Amanita muscaria (strain Koide BX008) TaxID=946122 RepID=A0A0C2X030_AMAMK|nr:hypothetical protein M378DRAFT_166153 [Amanita muscaria Koide BX008]
MSSHRRGILSILGISDSLDLSKETVAEVMLSWNAVDFETEAAKRGMCATALRSFQEWDQHPHAQAMTNVLPVTIRKVGEAPKREMKSNITRPLDKVRVLDLSRVLAGPVAGRTLAAHGADVLLVTSPNLPSLPFLDIETSLGKRTTQLDLTQESDHASLIDLARDCDVFLQAYRPGGLEAKGFGVDDLVKLRPGIVCASLNAWGWEGPWKDRKGFDSLVQTATGFNFEEGKAYHEYMLSHAELGVKSSFAPKPFPMQTLDYAAGYFLAFGINAALARTMTEGGSWEVRVSLAAVGQWLRSLGRVSPEEAFGNGMGKFPSTSDDEEISKLSTTWPSVAGDGRSITGLRHPAVLSGAPVRQGDSGVAPMVLNANSACWL